MQKPVNMLAWKKANVADKGWKTKDVQAKRIGTKGKHKIGPSNGKGKVTGPSEWLKANKLPRTFALLSLTDRQHFKCSF